MNSGIATIIGLLCILHLQTQVNGCNPAQRLIKVFCKKLEPCDMAWTCDTSLRDQGYNGTALCWHNDWDTRDRECKSRGLYARPWRFSIPAPLVPGGRCFCCHCPEGKNCDFPGVKNKLMAFYGKELFNKIDRNASTDGNCWFDEKERDDWCSLRFLLHRRYELDLPVTGYGKLYCCG